MTRPIMHRPHTAKLVLTSCSHRRRICSKSSFDLRKFICNKGVVECTMQYGDPTSYVLLRHTLVRVYRYFKSCLAGFHYSDVIMGAMASQITSIMIVYTTVYSGADQRTHQSPASPAFARGIHRWPVNSSHKWPVTRKMFPFDDVLMRNCY